MFCVISHKINNKAVKMWFLIRYVSQEKIRKKTVFKFHVNTLSLLLVVKDQKSADCIFLFKVFQYSFLEL